MSGKCDHTGRFKSPNLYSANMCEVHPRILIPYSRNYPIPLCMRIRIVNPGKVQARSYQDDKTREF